MEKYNNQMTVVMESRSQNESLARTVVAAFIAPLDPSMDVLTDIKTAVSEAVTNAVIHGYKNELGEITLAMSLLDGELRISVSDKGAGIANIQQAMEPLYTTTSPEMERAGMGFTVMESFMGKVTVHSSPGQGTSVEMIKDLSGKESAAAWTTL
ncbi:MAG: anti-sigma F factor [Defluviitaleaceae bacterium]|nr:anti-sigma F factor [Defluviitaleaceae bacterium]